MHEITETINGLGEFSNPYGDGFESVEICRALKTKNQCLKQSLMRETKTTNQTIRAKGKRLRGHLPARSKGSDRSAQQNLLIRRSIQSA